MDQAPPAPTPELVMVAYQYLLQQNGRWDNLPSDWSEEECSAYDRSETRKLETRYQAESVIANLHSLLTEARPNSELFWEERLFRKATEAKLAQYENQVPVGYVGSEFLNSLKNVRKDKTINENAWWGEA